MARRLIVEGQRNKRLQKSLDDDALVDGIPAPLSTGLLDNSAVAANFALLRRVLGSVGRDVAIFDVPRLQARYWN